jgi:hypothetical protein
LENDGHALWQMLVEFNYGITADNIPNLKIAFYDGAIFRQKKGHSIDQWAAEVRSSSAVLTFNGHAITKSEKTTVFRRGLIREDMQQNLILPARTENFEQLVATARIYFQSTTTTSSSSSTSQRVSMLTARRNFAHTVSQNLGENCNTRVLIAGTNDRPQIQMIKMCFVIDATKRAITPLLVPILLPLEDTEAEMEEDEAGVDAVAHIIGLQMVKERRNTQLL